MSSALGRNDPCLCGSGKKYKRCCGAPVPTAQARGAPANHTHAAGLHAAASTQLAMFMNAGRYREAEQLARELAQRHPDSALVWKAQGAALLLQGKESLGALRKAVELAPRDAEAHYYLGSALHEAGETAHASAAFERALELKPDFAEAHTDLGAVRLEQNLLAQATASFRAAIARKPQSAEAHGGLANALRAAGQLDEAAAGYRRALELDPNLVAAHHNLGNVLMELGDFDAAVASYGRALELDAHHAQALGNLPLALRAAGRAPEAEAAARRLCEASPQAAESWHVLGLAQLDGGKLEQAVASFRQALVLDAHHPEAHAHLGNALVGFGKLHEAADSCRRAIALQPRLADAHRYLGNILVDLGRLGEAAASLRQALALDPGAASTHAALGVVLRRMGKPAEAEACFTQALDCDPHCAAALASLGELQADRGRFEEAQALFARAIELDPDLAEAYALIARYRRMTEQDAGWLAHVQRLLEKSLPVGQEINLRYALGKYFDDIKDYDKAFENYRLANDLSKRYGVTHDRRRLTQRIDRIIDWYGAAWFERVRAEANASRLPVFIVGMPRSGTTLVEQIVAAHPKAHGAGELSFWNDAVIEYESFVHGDAARSAGTLELLARQYLNDLERHSPDAARIVDKMPANFLNLGMIIAALPHARIIHMQRHPLDTCLSIYFQSFLTIQAYANDLEDIAHYHGEYTRLMHHWRRTLPAHSMLELRYEDLIEDPETSSRRLLEFLDLPWDARVLDFHESSRSVITASSWQVRQRINKASLGRWQHYRDHLGPLMHLNPP